MTGPSLTHAGQGRNAGRNHKVHLQGPADLPLYLPSPPLYLSLSLWIWIYDTSYCGFSSAFCATDAYMGCSTFSEYTVLPEIAVAKINSAAPLDKVFDFFFSLSLCVYVIFFLLLLLLPLPLPVLPLTGCARCACSAAASRQAMARC